MNDTCTRYENFLEHYEFNPNNKQFRINSSKALEKFKNVQAYQLNQLANGKYRFKQETTEILLLKYDMWAKWVYELESLCIEIMSKRAFKTAEKKDIELFISLSDKTTNMYKNIMESNPEYFNKKTTNIWLEMHNIPYNYLITEIRKLEGLNFDVVYVRIIDLLIEVMQYTLVELYEIDINLCKSTPCISCDNLDICGTRETKENISPYVLVYSDICLKVYNSLGIKLVLERAKLYLKYFNVDTIYFKNYTDMAIPTSCVNEVEELGINIDYKYSLLHKRL